jgi:hypothetical protein
MPVDSIKSATFEDFYAGPAPWDIGKPQGPFVAVACQFTDVTFSEGGPKVWVAVILRQG